MANCNNGEEAGYSYTNSHEYDGVSNANKYGPLLPKKQPLISTDHERAYFDSADWALGKQSAGINQKSHISSTVETLRPKLQRTPHQRLPPRRPACTSGRDIIVD